MTRRAKRRRYAIIGALAEHGQQSGLDLCLKLHRGPGTIYPDLAALEGESRIIGEWEQPGNAEATYGPAPVGAPTPRPRRRLYRLATDDERKRGRRIRHQVEQEIADRVAARTPPRRRIPILRPNGGVA